ncbi:MAG TPA: hypothetical protein VF692_06140 [Pyrinomonadaceae bacterium]|jgi:hypothetical protein
MKNIIRFCFFLLVLFASLTTYGKGVFAPYTYAASSANNKYLFVMIAPPGEERNATERSQKLRAEYPKSGMYLNDGSVKPLWTVEWYSFGVFVASDGIHLVRQGSMASSLDDEAFTFFAADKEIRSYKVRDVARKGVLQMASHLIWQADIKIDDDEKTLSVTTLGEEKYSFDYRSGQRKIERNQLMAIEKRSLSTFNLF